LVFDFICFLECWSINFLYTIITSIKAFYCLATIHLAELFPVHQCRRSTLVLFSLLCNISGFTFLLIIIEIIMPILYVYFTPCSRHFKLCKHSVKRISKISFNKMKMYIVIIKSENHSCHCGSRYHYDYQFQQQQQSNISGRKLLNLDSVVLTLQFDGLATLPFFSKNPTRFSVGQSNLVCVSCQYLQRPIDDPMHSTVSCQWIDTINFYSTV